MNTEVKKQRRGVAIRYLKKIAAHFFLRKKEGIGKPIKTAADVASAIYTLEFNPKKRVAGDRDLALRARASVIPEFLHVSEKLRASKKPHYKRLGHYLEVALKDALL